MPHSETHCSEYICIGALSERHQEAALQLIHFEKLPGRRCRAAGRACDTLEWGAPLPGTRLRGRRQDLCPLAGATAVPGSEDDASE